MHRIIVVIFFYLSTISLTYAFSFNDSSQKKAESILQVYNELLNNRLKEKKSEVKAITDRTLSEIKKYNKNEENIENIRYMLYEFIQGKLMYNNENNNSGNYKTHILDIFILRVTDKKTKILIHADGRKLITKINDNKKNVNIEQILSELKNVRGRFEGSEREKRYRSYTDVFSWQRGKISGVDGIYMAYKYHDIEDYLITIKYDKKIITDNIIIASNLLNTIIEKNHTVLFSTKECFILHHTLSSFLYKTLKNPSDDEKMKIRLKFRDIFIETIKPPQEKLCNVIKDVPLNDNTVYSYRSEKEITTLKSLTNIPDIIIGVSIKTNNNKIFAFVILILLLVVLILILKKINIKKP